MAKRLFIAAASVLFAGELMLTAASAAPPECGRKACREEIDLCQETQCAGLSGRDRAVCRRDCVRSVIDACEVDPTVCNPVTTSTTTTTTSTTTSTTSPYGSPSRAFLSRAADLLD